jgi:hypothetical protein
MAGKSLMKTGLFAWALVLWLAAGSEAAWVITANPSGLVSLSQNPFAGVLPSHNFTTQLEISANASERVAGTGGGGRIRGAAPLSSGTQGFFDWSGASPFTVGTIITVDYAYSTWGPYSYGISLNGVDQGLSFTAAAPGPVYHIATLPTWQTHITSARTTFTQLGSMDNSATLYEVWLLPDRLNALPLTGASVTSTTGGTYGSAAELFDGIVGTPLLLNGAATSMTVDLAGTQLVKAILAHTDWRPNAMSISYFDGAWHPLVSLDDAAGYGADVLTLSSATAMSQLRFDFTPKAGFGDWAGLTELAVFTAIPIPEPGTLALVAIGLGLSGGRARRRAS